MKYWLSRVSVFVYVIMISGSVFGMQEKPITIVIPSYNNQEWYQRNIKSVAMQNYNNYRAIYINDCSTDGTGDLVRAYVEELGMSDRFTIIDNPVRCGALFNLYRTIHSCDDYEIIVTLDADDWFATDNALARVNQAYQDGNTWLTYGQFMTYDDNKEGFCRELPQRIIKHNVIREYNWVTSHLRTFYAGLFKQVPLKELLYKGTFFDVTWDMAFLYPMLEMSALHSTFIPDILYVYNIANPSNDFKKKIFRQVSCKYFIQSRDKYSPIKSIETQKKSKILLVVFSDGHSDQLRDFLKNIRTYAKHIYEMKILYKSDQSNQQKKSYEYIVPYGPQDDLQAVLMRVLNESGSDYVLFTDDKNRFQESCDLLDCISALKSTHGHTFYLGLGRKSQRILPPMVPVYPLNSSVYAWQYKYAGFAFKHPYNVDMALYKKNLVQSDLKSVVFNTPEQMVTELNSMQFDYEHVGLCFDNAKTVRI